MVVGRRIKIWLEDVIKDDIKDLGLVKEDQWIELGGNKEFATAAAPMENRKARKRRICSSHLEQFTMCCLCSLQGIHGN